MPEPHSYAMDCPADRTKVIDLYFMEHRAKLIDLASFLDRVERSDGEDDFRIEAFRSALALVSDGQPEKARRVLEHFSDHSADAIERAPGKGASGAVDPSLAGGGA